MASPTKDISGLSAARVRWAAVRKRRAEPQPKAEPAPNSDFYQLAETSQSEGLLLEASYFGLCAATEDKTKGTTAFLEKRAPRFHGRRETRRGQRLRRDAMASDNIFSGLKVLDFASFIAGPSAAVILPDFGADVIKVEPPTGDLWRHGHKMPPQPQAEDPYQWHLANRNKRGMTLDLKSPSAQEVLERLVKWADVLIVNTPHLARKRLKLEYDDVAQWNPRLIYADLTGFGEKGPDANLPGFDITSYWARSGLLSMTRDAGAPPTWPVAGSGDNATAVGLYSAIVTALYRRERTGKGANVTTSLLAEGVWAASVSVQGALCGAKFFGLHDRKHPANAAMNVYRPADDTWFVLQTS